MASVSANAAHDVAGNPNALTTSVVNSDRTAPTVTISPNSLTTNASPILFTFQFTEQVTEFDASDINVTNGAKGRSQSGGDPGFESERYRYDFNYRK